MSAARWSSRDPLARAFYDELRRWAYRTFRHTSGDQVAWRADVLTAAADLRQDTLVDEELATQIALQTADWIWEHFDRDWTPGTAHQTRHAGQDAAGAAEAREPVPAGYAVRTVTGQPTWHLPAGEGHPPQRMGCGVRLRLDRAWEHLPPADFPTIARLDRCRRCFPTPAPAPGQGQLEGQGQIEGRIEGHSGGRAAGQVEDQD
ncbi:hypothetical protein [Kineococcus sp. SYSU DK004]|uniref:hypothetical protein n=1 Tax=Kineococcus sp. SYSU DK004 TaxID=3383125 RepID=UPI003D7C6F88